MSILSTMLGSYGDDLSKAAGKVVANNLDDVSGMSLKELLKLSGKNSNASSVDELRESVISALSDPKVGENIRQEIFGRTPVAGRVWNDVNKIKNVKNSPGFFSQAFQYGDDLDNILYQYANEAGEESAITLSDLDKAFSGDLFTGTGDLYSPYSQEGSRAFYEWAKDKNITPSSRMDIRNKYFSPLLENADKRGWRPSDIMRYDENIRPTGARYDEFVSVINDGGIVPETQYNFSPTDVDNEQYWTIESAEDSMNNYRKDLIKKLAGKNGRTILNKIIPSVAAVGGLGAIAPSVVNNERSQNG